MMSSIDAAIISAASRLHLGCISPEFMMSSKDTVSFFLRVQEWLLIIDSCVGVEGMPPFCPVSRNLLWMRHAWKWHSKCLGSVSEVSRKCLGSVSELVVDAARLERSKGLGKVSGRSRKGLGRVSEGSRKGLGRLGEVSEGSRNLPWMA